jgi:3',5'-cyclic AMP phosphodiesterase CpdA
VTTRIERKRMFVLAHLSDPHIGPLPRPRLADLASKRMVGYVNWLRGRSRAHRLDTLDALTRDLAAQAHDHTAVTGDLVNIALPAEFATAQAWLDRLGSPADVTFVPGNHDAYVRAALPYWDKHWEAFMQGDEEAARDPQALVARFPFVRRRGLVAFVGLSSAVPTAPLSAAGRLGREQIARAAEILRRLADEGLFRVVLIHHPLRHRWASPHKRLIDAAAFRRALALAGAELVLHGHDHRHALVWLDGPGHPIPVVGIPSASAGPHGRHDEPAGYNLYSIAGGLGAWTCEVISRGFRRGATSVGETGRYTLSIGGAGLARQ